MPTIPPDLAERFRRVCPEWARHILNKPHLNFEYRDMIFLGTDGLAWNIKRSHGCIVGEAHGRQVDYELEGGCDKCETFAIRLADLHRKIWPTILKEFLDHYESKHAVEVPA